MGANPVQQALAYNTQTHGIMILLAQAGLTSVRAPTTAKVARTRRSQHETTKGMCPEVGPLENQRFQWAHTGPATS